MRLQSFTHTTHPFFLFRHWLAITAIFTCATSTYKAAATSWQVEEAQSQVEFTAIGKPGFLRINGQGAKIRGNATEDKTTIKGSFQVQLEQLTTGMALRDEHMKTKYLEVSRYPLAVLVWTASYSPQNGTAEVPFNGQLKLHGVEKPISGTAKIATEGKRADVEAQFSIKLGDFGIAIPEYLGVTVADNVEIQAKVVAIGADASPP